MGYKIPPEDEVTSAVLKVVKSKRVVESQNELLHEVMKHLRRKNAEYRISGRRLRLIALKTGKIKMEIRYRITDKHVDNLEICPVCGEKMVKVENATLDGGRVVVGFKCTQCPYWTGKTLRLPIRYIFRFS